MNDVVGVLDALGDAFEGEELAQSIVGDDTAEILVRHFGVNGHHLRSFELAQGGVITPPPPCAARAAR